MSFAAARSRMWPEWYSRSFWRRLPRRRSGICRCRLAQASRRRLPCYLTHEPTKVSKSRIKRLRGLSLPQYRLRVGDIRVFYDVTETQVQVLAIVTKAEAQSWLDEQGTPSQGRKGSGAGAGEG